MKKRITKRQAVVTRGRHRAAIVTKKVRKKSLEDLLIQHGSTPERLALLELADEFILLRGEMTGGNKSLHVLMLDLDRKFDRAIGAHVASLSETLQRGIDRKFADIDRNIQHYTNEAFDRIVRKKTLDDLLPRDEKDAQAIRGAESFAPEPELPPAPLPDDVDPEDT